jgi:hypothetical protein
VLARKQGLEVVGACLVTGTILLLFLQEAVMRFVRKSASAGSAEPVPLRHAGS